MLIIVAYSCFASAYFTAFDFPKGDLLLWNLEHIVFVSFTFDIIFTFVRIPDNGGDEKQKNHSTIAKKYLKSGMFFFDVLATFPFYLMSSSGDLGIWFKLLRLVRIPRIVALLDLSKFNKLVESVSSGQTRGKRVVFQMVMKNVYKVFRLIMLTIIITYFTGCLFYFMSDCQNKLFSFDGDTFITANNLNTPEYSQEYKFITSCYFSITTLSTVGYGDLYPISNAEKIFGIMIMLGGVGFFSFIMGSFIEIISTFN
jgi:hypothetical protein